MNAFQKPKTSFEGASGVIVPDAPSVVSASGETAGGKELLVVSRSQWYWTIGFYLSATLTGLRIPLGLIFIIAILFNRWKYNRYDFIIQLMIIIGEFGLFYTKATLLPMPVVAFGVACVLLFVYRKPQIVRQSLLVLGVYAAVLVFLATFSDESLRIQFLLLRHHLLFIFILIPLAVFHNREFDIREFCRRLLPYFVIMSVYYVIDGWILSGQLFLPSSRSWAPVDITSFWIHPFSFDRMSPFGLYIFIPCVWPLAKWFKLSKWMWIVIALAFIVSQTFTLIVGFAVFYILISGHGMQLLKYGSISVVLLVIGYFVDDAITPPLKTSMESSTIRIKSSVDQFVRLYEDFDDPQVLADFASGRIAQALPKFELITKRGSQLTGLGFIHPDYSSKRKYTIINELYQNQGKAEEMATTIESVPLQVYFNVGYLGVAAHYLFLLALWLVVRKLPNAGYFGWTLLLACFTGLTGLASLLSAQGWAMVDWTWAAVILSSRDSLPGFRKLTHDERLSSVPTDR